MSLVTLDDRDSSIIYSSGQWGHGGSSSEFDHTTTWADVAGATAQLTFQGSSIAVYGTIPKQCFGCISPVSSYSVDGSAPVEFRAVEDGKIQYSQLFFQSPVLTGDTHTLVITNDLNSDPIYLDFLKVNTAVVAPPPPSTTSSPPPPVSPPPPASPTTSPSPSSPPSSAPSSPSSPSSSLSNSLSSPSPSSGSPSPSTSTNFSGSTNSPYVVYPAGQPTSGIVSNYPSSATASLGTAGSAPGSASGGASGDASSSGGASAASGVRATKASNSGAIAGGIVAAVVAVILIICGLIFWRRRQQRRRTKFRRQSFGNFISAKSDSFWGPVNSPSSHTGPRAQPFDLEALPPSRPPQPTMTQAENTASYPYTQPGYASGYVPGTTYNDTAYMNPAYATSVTTVESSSELSYYGQEHSYLQDHAF